jgi:hypothetical protein
MMMMMMIIITIISQLLFICIPTEQPKGQLQRDTSERIGINIYTVQKRRNNNNNKYQSYLDIIIIITIIS